MTDIAIFKEALEMAESKKKFAIATVIEAEGSTLAKPGFKLLIDDDGVVHSGSLGGGCPESAIIPGALDSMKAGLPRTLKVHLENSETALQAMVKGSSDNEVYVETFCGGSMTIFIEPFLPKRRVIVISQGGRDSVEESLIELLKWADFHTVLVSPSPDMSKGAEEVFNLMEHGIGEFIFDPMDFIVVMTKGNKDLEILEFLSKKERRYVGLMASRKRIAHDFEELRKIGVSEEFLSSVHAPIGIDISAITPKEIALSIVSEIVKESREETKTIQV